MEYVRALKYYGYMQFSPSVADYPFPGAPVQVSIGNYELSIRLQTGSSQTSIPKGGGIFKVTRMRCWRITTLHDVCEFKYYDFQLALYIFKCINLFSSPVEWWQW